MIVKDPSTHLYQLENLIDKNAFQNLQFIHKDENGNTVTDGTTNEEVMKALVARIKFQNEKFPCEENEKAIKYIKEAFFQLKARTERINKENSK